MRACAVSCPTSAPPSAPGVEQGALADSVDIVVELDEAALWRLMPDLHDWAMELATRPDVSELPRAAELLGTAARAAWLRGELDAAQRLVDDAMRLATNDIEATRAIDVMGTLALFGGDLELARERYLARRRRPARLPSLPTSAALAAIYAGDRQEAERLLQRAEHLAGERRSLTDRAFYLYARRARGPARSRRGARGLRRGHRAGTGERGRLRGGHRLGRAGPAVDLHRPDRPGAARVPLAARTLAPDGELDPAVDHPAQPRLSAHRRRRPPQGRVAPRWRPTRPRSRPRSLATPSSSRPGGPWPTGSVPRRWPPSGVRRKGSGGWVWSMPPWPPSTGSAPDGRGQGRRRHPPGQSTVVPRWGGSSGSRR